MDEVLVVTIVFIILAATGCVASYFAGGGVERTNWKADCEQIGLHRGGDKVYECRPMGK